jgi:outer membrane protein OmpA-like peptidoglycan-associated protein
LGDGRRPSRDGGERGSLGGDYWAIAAYLAVPALVLLLLATALPTGPPAALPEARIEDVRERLRERTLALQELPRLLASLCREPRLLRAGLGPSCREGTMTLDDETFFDRERRELLQEGKRRLRIAIPILLDALRENESIWDQLEVIEVRGHADPRAKRDPYPTNLRASQARAMTVLLFLTSDPQLREQDRLDLRRLAVSSGASHSRPPADCRVRSPECDGRAKRVELRLGFDALLERAALGDFYDEMMRALSP